MAHQDTPNTPSGDADGRYLVVARRYRPRTFDELLGQSHVALALRNAITSGRVGHAYLFTGARGVGKTSAARIFAKALNCVNGPTPEPCNACDICLSVDSGDDVDVLEIDGASNRGIEEIRQLRSNVNVRPSRAHYKIYIIDEVHMLTMQAFNALLKTLEEPPEHVKFIFCTTDPEKIPITVLSRCQRFDFAPIGAQVIVDRLAQIVRQEGREVEPSALELLARRAAGSMRDSQSLLEQLLAFCGPKITLEDVNNILGVADNQTLQTIVHKLIARDAPAALSAADAALRSGVEPGHLAEQLLAYFRDLLVAAVGGSPDLALATDPTQWAELTEAGRQIGPETLLAIAQTLDQSLVRMRQSTHAKILLELALVRICGMDRLDDLAELVRHLRRWETGELPAPPPAPAAANVPTSAPNSASAPAPSAPSASASAPQPAPNPSQKKSPHAAEPLAKSPVAPTNGADEPAGARAMATEQTAPVEEASPAPREAVPLTRENAERLWKQAVSLLEGITADVAGEAKGVAILAPNRLAVTFRVPYNKEQCERPDRKSEIEKALQQVSGQRIQVEFRVEADPAETQLPPPPRSTRQLIREKERHELVVQAVKLFDAEIVRLEPPANPDATSTRHA